MSTTYALPDQIAETSTQRKARAAGVLWLICILTSILGAAVALPMIVRTDAAATAANIMAKESLFRLGVLSGLMSGASYLGVTVLLYYLLKPVSASLSLSAALFGVTGEAVGAVSSVASFIPLILLHGGQYTAFTTGQLQQMALFAVTLQMGTFFSVGMIFFGVQCLIAGYLIARSAFLPRTLGILLAIGGASYIFVSFANLLAPGFGVRLAPFLAFGLVGEGSLTVWLLVRGVNAQRWKEQASAAWVSRQKLSSVSAV